MILQRSTAEIDSDVNILPAVESKVLYAAAKDIAKVVEFWSTEQRQPEIPGVGDKHN